MQPLDPDLALPQLRPETVTRPAPARAARLPHPGAALAPTCGRRTAESRPSTC